MRIQPFAAWRPPAARAASVASVPYDTVDRAEACELAAGNPDCFLHVVRADIDLPGETDPYAPEIYQRAAENLAALRARGALIQDSVPGLYVYRQVMGGHCQEGLVACCHTGDYDRGRIKKHEFTRPDKENDRVRLMHALRAQSGPVFLTYRDDPDVSAQVRDITATEPETAFTAEDGVQHQVWRIAAPESMVQAFAAVPDVYIADGHHRAAAAARISHELRGAHGTEWFLAVLFPASRLNILPYNRLILDLNGLTADELRAASARRGIPWVACEAAPASRRPGEVYAYLNHTWYRLPLPPPVAGNPAAALDVSRLQDHVLAPLLGIDDPRTSQRIQFVGGIRGMHELSGRVDGGRAAAAFVLHPVAVEDMMAIADAGTVMPPKSTWFEPKLRSGLFVNMWA